jgi:methionyl-tRNA formyltransferase
MGADAIALPLLDWTRGAGRATAEVVGVFTQPDRAAEEVSRCVRTPSRRGVLRPVCPCCNLNA